MDIGTAKPTKEERQIVNHHMMDFLEPSCEYSISTYQKDVRALIDEFHRSNKIPLLVGGSGLYLDSVIKDYRFLENARKQETEEKYLELNNEELHKILEELNLKKAKEIHHNNRKRVLRAIELELSPIDEDSRSHSNDLVYDALVIFLNDEREKLYNRINERVDQMITSGLVNEIESIGINNFSLTSSKAIGYKEIIDYLNQQVSLEDAINAIKQNSRHYAKRQITWFKNKTSARELLIDFENFNNTINEVKNIIDTFLKGE